MISLIIKSYFDILLSIGIGSLCAFLLGLYCLLSKIKPASIALQATSEDFSAIAGDDVMVTQLDLARAYIETDKKSVAKHILKSVVAQGTATQQKEAQRLLNTL